MAKVPSRRLLGTVTQVGCRQKVYALPNGFEIDEYDHGHVTRKRVFYEDVLMVTYHRFRGIAFLWVTGLLALAVGGLGLFVSLSISRFGPNSNSDQGALIVGVIFLIIFLAIAIPFVLRLIFCIDAITVFGKRTKAQLHFKFRKSRAREVYAWICKQTQQTQAALTEARNAERGGEAETSIPPTVLHPPEEGGGTPAEPGPSPTSP